VKPRLVTRVLVAVAVLAMVAVAAVTIYSRANPVWGEWEGVELSPWSGSPTVVEGVSMDFGARGILHGFNSCAPFNALYSVKADTLLIADRGTGLKGCLNENGAMGDAVHDILLSDPWITRDGDILILESPAGRLTLVRT